jgi:hypothetical protein
VSELFGGILRAADPSSKLILGGLHLSFDIASIAPQAASGVAASHGATPFCPAETRLPSTLKAREFPANSGLASQGLHSVNHLLASRDSGSQCDVAHPLR